MMHSKWWELAIDYEDVTTAKPELKMYAAVLERAIRDAAEEYKPQKYSKRPSRWPPVWRESGREWLYLDVDAIPQEDLDSPYEFSFCWVADELGLNAKQLRQRIILELPRLQRNAIAETEKRYERHKKKQLQALQTTAE